MCSRVGNFRSNAEFGGRPLNRNFSLSMPNPAPIVRVDIRPLPRTLLAVFCIAVIICQGCVQAKLNGLLGKDRHALLSTFGPPTQVLPDGEGGNVWVYTKARSVVNRGYQAPPLNTNGMSAGNAAAAGFARGLAQGMNRPSVETKLSHRMIYLNSAGVIYKWSIAKP